MLVFYRQNIDSKNNPAKTIILSITFRSSLMLNPFSTILTDPCLCPFTRFPSNNFQFSSVTQSCLTFCDPMNRSTPGLLSITNSRSSLRLRSIESVMPSSHLILCRPLLLLPPIPPSIRVFSNESTLSWGGQSTGVSALASFLPKKSQG